MQKTNLLQKTLSKTLEAVGFNITLNATQAHYTVDIVLRTQDHTIVIDCMDSIGYVGVHTLICNIARKQKIFNADKAVLALYNAPVSDYNIRAAEKNQVTLWGKYEVDSILDTALEERRGVKTKVLELLTLGKVTAPEKTAESIPEKITHTVPATLVSLKKYASEQPWTPNMDYILDQVFAVIFHPGMKKIDGLKHKRGHFLAFKGKKPPYVLHTPTLASGGKYSLDEIDSLLSSIKQKEGDIDYLLAYTQIGTDLLKMAEKNNVRCLICDSIERKGMFSRKRAFDKDEAGVCVITTGDLVDYIKESERR